VPEDAAAAVPAARVPLRGRVHEFAAQHWLFALALVLAAVLRAFAVLAYRPVQWFNDSFPYVTAAVHLVPETIRPSGYALLLAALEPLHRFAAVTGVQHLLGLATGAGVYAVLRVRGVRALVATLAALPVLLDAYEIQLEHLVMADTLFMFLVTAGVVLLCLRNQPGWILAGAAGLLLGASAVVRTDGRPLLVVVALCLIVRRAGWRPVVALAVTGLLPLAAYAGWFHVARGPYALTGGDGAFLYSRAMAFADCAQMNPPPSLRPLCDNRPPAKRPPSADYVWDSNPLRTYAGNPWGARASSLGGQFAWLALRRQPAAYLYVVAEDVARTFSLSRSLQFPDPATASQYQFATHNAAPPGWAPFADLHAYQPSGVTTHVYRPYSSLLVRYQRYFYFRGPLLLLTLLIGGAWVVTGRRRGAPGLLPWCVAVALIAVPPATAGFSYRYVLAAIPCACIAAGMAAVPGRIRRSPQAPQPAGDAGVGQPLRVGGGQPAGPAASQRPAGPAGGEQPAGPAAGEPASGPVAGDEQTGPGEPRVPAELDNTAPA